MKIKNIFLCVRFFPLEETIVKVESSLLDETNDPSTSQYLNESNHEYLSFIEIKIEFYCR